MRPGDRLICALIEPQPIGHRFKAWPLHVTVVPWFRIELSDDDLAESYGRSLVGVEPFKIKVGESNQFGYKKRKQVNLVEAPELMRIEGQTRRFLHAHKSWVVDEADKTRRGFRPHVTVQGDQKMREGDSFGCDRLYIITQYGEYKEEESIISLSL